MKQRDVLSEHPESESPCRSLERNQQSFVRKPLKDFAEKVVWNVEFVGKFPERSQIPRRFLRKIKNTLNSILTLPTKQNAHIH